MEEENQKKEEEIRITKLLKENPELEKFLKYFEEDLTAIDEELLKSKRYSKIIDDQIDTFSDSYSKGAAHYLIENITNAIELQKQRQSLRKDRFSIKKTIMDYSNKDGKTASESANLEEAVNQLLKITKDNKKLEETKNSDDSSMDDEIDKILDKNDNKGK